MKFNDFVSKYKTFEIWEFIFREPTVKDTFELREFRNEAVKSDMDEIEFYVSFLGKILDKGEESWLKDQIMAMPLNQATKFFFYVLDQLGINFTRTLNPKQSDESKD